MPYLPKDPSTDPPPQPDELRRLDLEQDNSGAAMRPWIVAGIAAIVVVMLVYGYNAPVSTTASARRPPPARRRRPLRPSIPWRLHHPRLLQQRPPTTAERSVIRRWVAGDGARGRPSVRVGGIDEMISDLLQLLVLRGGHPIRLRNGDRGFRHYTDALIVLP
jgi:hypothetical protein